MMKLNLIAKLFLLALIFSCGRSTRKKSTEVWPNVSMDTMPAPDFSIDSMDSKGEITVRYTDSILVKHKKIIINSRFYYIVEGDMLLNEYKYNQYRIGLLIKQNELFNQKLSMIKPSPNLRIDVINDTAVRWPENLPINFCINKSSFSSEANYEMVKRNILTAMNDWMHVCNINFKYRPVFDNRNYFHGNSDVDFVVVEYNAEGSFIAKAFFPRDPVQERNLIIDPSYYTTQFNKVGVFRHELGHILGFRHEHISPDAPTACPDEIITGTLALTKYDPKSVMHYFCGGVGSLKLEISHSDTAGSVQLYGAPVLLATK
jgi:hypothetical protein